MTTASTTLPQAERAAKHMSEEKFERIVAIITIAVPMLGFIAALFLLWGHLVSWTDLIICLSFYVLTVCGVTIGFHRYFTHKSFQCLRPVQWALGIAGSMSAQGPLLFWVACHRKHHKTSDEADDPHSPHHHGGGPWGVVKGCLHAHMSWMVNHRPENYLRWAPDVARDKIALLISRRYFSWVLLGILAPGIIGGLISQSWFGFMTGALWGGLVRVFLVHHSTWSINSVCHLFGSRDYETKDHSRNNVICAILALGEGWHNNHHAFPTSARHGLSWWQVDASYLIIKTMEKLGLVWDVKVPDKRVLARKDLAAAV